MSERVVHPSAADAVTRALRDTTPKGLTDEVC